jgi:hypothetical protein
MSGDEQVADVRLLHETALNAQNRLHLCFFPA